MPSPYEIRLIVQPRNAGYLASRTSPQSQRPEEVGRPAVAVGKA